MDNRNSQVPGAEYWISIRLEHPTMDPSGFADRFGVSAVRKWRAGEPRTTPKGQPLDGVYPSSYWCYSSKGLFPDVDSAMEPILKILEGASDFLSHFVGSGGQVAV